MSEISEATGISVISMRMSIISIGEYEYSYYHKSAAGQRLGESHLPFSPASLLDVMRKIG